MERHIVLRVVSKGLIPFILLFALYVQFHGDYGPGGGFQAGVIFAAAFVLYTLIYGLPQAKKVAPARMLEVLAALGVLLYAGTGVVTIYKGGKFLDYNVLVSPSKEHSSNKHPTKKHAVKKHSHSTSKPVVKGGMGFHSRSGGHAKAKHDSHNHAAVKGQHLGIFLVELGVGIAVTTVITLIFFTFAGRERT